MAAHHPLGRQLVFDRHSKYDIQLLQILGIDALLYPHALQVFPVLPRLLHALGEYGEGHRHSAEKVVDPVERESRVDILAVA